jgi:hypothetical protein
MNTLTITDAIPKGRLPIVTAIQEGDATGLLCRDEGATLERDQPVEYDELAEDIDYLAVSASRNGAGSRVDGARVAKDNQDAAKIEGDDRGTRSRGRGTVSACERQLSSFAAS